MLNITGTHANFSVDDIKTAMDFYQGLGFAVKKEVPGGILFESPAGTRVNIYEKDDHEPWDSTVLGIEVDDVVSAVKELNDMGIDMENIPGTDDDGIVKDGEFEAAWFKDPAGNWLCVNNLA